MKLLFSCLLLISSVFAGPEMDDQTVNGTRLLLSTTIENRIRIDGALDEPEWLQARFQSDFVQREPDIGKPATEETQVAVLTNEKFLYIGLKCYDSDPSKIIAREMMRDARMDEDDNVQIVFDTYNDKRNGFYFVVNPNGCRRDATFGDEGKSYNSEWDGIWECRATINDSGWFVEVAIPWKTLRFAKSDTATWGLNVARTIRRKNESTYWQLIPRDAGRRGIFRLSQAGALAGLSNMHAGGNLEIKPYLLGGAAKDAATEFALQNVQDFGIDARFNISSNITANLTWNTDFAQVESDQERVNLTRFSLFFPEKRDFFLDGAEMFNFGGQSISGRRGPGNGIRLFYSRRIGIEEGHLQPIVWGLKMFGKSGRFQTGVLNVLTEEMTVTEENDDGEEEEHFFPASNFTVVRVRREVLRRSSIGLMALNKGQIHSGHYNRSGGIDANFPLTDVFSISGAAAATFGPDEIEDETVTKMSEKNLAASFEMSYDSDLFEATVSHLNIQDNFNAEMGYVRRTGIKNTEIELGWSPRPQGLPAIRQFLFRFSGNYLTDQSNHRLEAETGPMFGLRFQNGSFLFTGIRYETEYLDEDWELRPGFWAPSAEYYGWNTFLWFRGDESRDISVGMRASYGDYYTGTRLSFGPELLATMGRRFRAELDVDVNYVRMPEGEFTAQTFGCRLFYYFSTNLYFKAYVQLNDDRLANDGDRITLANVLLRWTFRPGSDFYIVYNDRRLFGASGGQIDNRTIMAKATFFWRK